MKKTILLYSLALAALIFLLKLVEYRFFARDLSLEFYLGLVALVFTALGAWVGLRLTKKKAISTVPPEGFKPKAVGGLGVGR